MSFKVVRDNNIIPEIVSIIEKLNKTEIHIGIFGKDDSHLLMIANVNEFGCSIKPRRAKRLTIPLNKRARENSPRSFNDLFTLRAASGELYLVRKKGKDQLEFMYWLAKEVHIPERAFIRGGFDSNKDRFGKRAASLLKSVLRGKIDMDAFFDTMGDFIVGEVRKYMTSLRNPPNASVTQRTKRGSNPLIDTGRLRDAITYKVVKK